MPELEPQTDPQLPAGTGSENAGGNPAPNGGGSATDDETVTLSKKDYAALVGDRDRNAEDHKKARGELEESQEFLNYLARKEFVSDFLTNNKEKYPDITAEDLQYATPETVEEEAQRIQRRLEDHTQAKILDIEKNGSQPRLSEDEVAARLEQLKKTPGAAALTEAHRLRLSRQ